MTGITRRSLINKSEGLIAAGTLARSYFIYTRAWAQVRTGHPFNVAIHDVTSGGMNAKDAVEKAYRRIEEIFAKYQLKA